MKEPLVKSYDAIYEHEVVILENLHFRWPRHREEALIKWTVPGGRLLEIGFGRGTVLYNLRKRYDQLYGVELSPVRVQIAQEAFRKTDVRNVHLLVGNIEKGLPFKDEQFDSIVWADVIEHVVDLWATMEEIRRLLCPGGSLITITPNFAKLRRRMSLLLGRFPSTSAKDEGFDVRQGELFDGGHTHYFTFSIIEKLYRKYRLKTEKQYGFGPAGRAHNIYPSLLSEGVFVLGKKE